MRVWFPYLIRKVNNGQSNVMGSDHSNHLTHARCLTVSRGTNKAVFVALPVIKHVTDKIRAKVLYRWVVSVFLLFCLLTSENYYPEWPITKNAYYRLKGANILGDL